MRKEDADLELDAKIRDQYKGINDTLVEYIREESGQIIDAINRDKRIILKSWETVRVSGFKGLEAMEHGDRRGEQKITSNLQDLQQKWNQKSLAQIVIS